MSSKEYYLYYFYNKSDTTKLRNRKRLLSIKEMENHPLFLKNTYKKRKDFYSELQKSGRKVSLNTDISNHILLHMDTKSLELLQSIYSAKKLTLYIPSCIIIKPQSLSKNITINITDYKSYCKLLNQYNQYPYRKRTMRLKMRSYWMRSKSAKTRKEFIEKFSENRTKISFPQIWSTKPIYEQDCFGVYDNGTFTKF